MQVLSIIPQNQGALAGSVFLYDTQSIYWEPLKRHIDFLICLFVLCLLLVDVCLLVIAITLSICSVFTCYFNLSGQTFSLLWYEWPESLLLFSSQNGSNQLS